VNSKTKQTDLYTLRKVRFFLYKLYKSFVLIDSGVGVAGGRQAETRTPECRPWGRINALYSAI